MDKNSKIVVVGLGYVGLPPAVTLARTYPVIGFDIDAERVAELERGEDRAREVEPDRLKASTLVYSADTADIRGADPGRCEQSARSWCRARGQQDSRRGHVEGCDRRL